MPGQIKMTPLPVMNLCVQQKQLEDGKKVHQIYLYDDISEYGEWNWNTYSYDTSETSAAYLRDVLNEIPDGEPIELYINSRGGSVKEGTAIFNLLKRKECEVTGYVDGVAHSIAFVILQACDKRIMGEGTSALIHEMWVSCMGNADQLRLQADQLDQWMQSSRALFLNRSKNLTDETLQELMKKETILTPEMALEYGLIDEIEGQAKNAEEVGTDDINQMKKKFDERQNFAEDIKEFEKLVKKEDEGSQNTEENTSMAAFFNAFL